MNYDILLSWAQGYMMLGMLDDAMRELELLPPEVRVGSEASEVYAALMMRRHEWGEALAVLKRLREECEVSDGQRINGAICLHKLGRTDEALEWHEQCGEEARKSAVFYYNLACYQAQLGQVDIAIETLRHACKLNPSYRVNAAEDPDLVPLRVLMECDSL
jgi:tetratricopeptide (TPR) repeat protein